MRYDLLPAQTEFLNIPHNYSLDVALYQGGFGSGKTFAGSLLGLSLALKYAGIRGLVGAQTFPLVRDTTLDQYMKHLDASGMLAGVHYDYNVSKGLLTFFNGSEILFRHLEEPNKLKSLNLGFVEIEEMSEVPESTFKMLLSRLRQKNIWGKEFQYRLFGHTNPEQNKGYIYKYFVEEKHNNYRFIHAPTTENTYLSEDYVEELRKAYDAEYFRINVMGEFGDYSSGLVVKNFTQDNIKEITYQPDMPLHLTWDFNVDPMSCILAHKTENAVYYFDEFILENASTRSTIEAVLEKYNNHRGRIIINGDASGDYRSTQSEATNYITIRNAIKDKYPNTQVLMHLRPSNPPIKARIAAFNAMVQNEKNERRLFIDPKCKRLLYNMHNLKYKIGTEVIDVPTYAQIRTDTTLKFLSHPFDAASYLVEYYFQLRLH